MTSQIDPRGPQFAAAITSLVLVVVLLNAPSTWAVGLLAVQAGLFAWGATAGVQQTPHAAAFRRWVRPRLGPPPATEDAEAPRFAQAVGLGFALTALVGYLAGPLWLGVGATAAALVAAVLNAVLRICLGCRLYGVCKLDRLPIHTPETIEKKEAHA